MPRTRRSLRAAKPTIAMIRGICFGGGVGIALATDLRICSSNSTFSIPAAKLGVGYGYAGIRRLVDIVGPAFAKEIFFSAGSFTAEDARIMGLVNRVVAPAELEDYVTRFASTISGNAPLTIRAAKLAIDAAVEDSERRRLRARRGGDQGVPRRAATMSRAAAPSWRSASRPSPADRRRSPRAPER